MDEFDIKLHEEIMESSLFSEEEKEILDSRFKKKQSLDLLYSKLDLVNPLSEDYMNVLDEISSIFGNRCEHDRDLIGICSSCFDLEKRVVNLHPEVFRNDPDFSDLFEDE